MSFAATLPNHLRPRREKIFGLPSGYSLDRNAKVRIRVYAEAWSAKHRQPGQHRGPLTRAFIEVLEALLWGFHNSKSGLCFPSYETIADKARCSRDTVYEAIKGLAHDLSKIARQAETAVLSAVCATFVCGKNRRKRQNQATFLSKRCFKNASEGQRSFEQAVSVRFWTNRAAPPPSAAWAQMSAI
jgi:hypothetical protein